MIKKEVIKEINETLEKIKQLFETKGATYANNNLDQLSNFKRLGTQLGLPPEATLLVYSTKHFDAISNFVKSLIYKIDTKDTEKIEGRIDDLILYLILLKCLLTEKSDELNNN